MFVPLKHSTIVAVLLVGGIASAGDTIRLGGRSADTQRLDLKASDRDKDVTEKACWFRGGYSYGYGYSPYYYGPAYPSYSLYSPPYISYYSSGFSYYGPLSYSFYAPVYYSVPRVYYYSPRVVAYGAVYPMALPAEPVAPAEEKQFRYDGDPVRPTEKIPPARLEEPAPAPPSAPAAPSNLKLGPSPVEMKVSLPATNAKKKYAYPAYGEKRSTTRDDKTLLIRGSR